jgi:hypothetical protein
MTALPQVGRCQHCQQVRPVFRWGDELQFPGGLPTGAWLCARDYSAATLADENNQPFRIEYDLEVWPWKAAKTRIFTPDGELLTLADQDLNTCEAILAATEENAS